MVRVGVRVGVQEGNNYPFAPCGRKHLLPTNATGQPIIYVSMVCVPHAHFHVSLNVVPGLFRLTAAATSYRKVEWVPYRDLGVGSLVFADRTYPFTSVSSYPSDCVFLRVSNDDKTTPGDQVQLRLTASRPVRVYLDFYGGPAHASMGFAKWQGGWEKSAQASTAFRETVSKVTGPGVVYTKWFDAGSIELYGNGDSTKQGTYYAFVCPGRHSRPTGPTNKPTNQHACGLCCLL